MMLPSAYTGSVPPAPLAPRFQSPASPAQPVSAPAPDPREMRSAPAPAADGWSGEDGASGHPEMTAQAIRRDAADFGACIAGFWPDAAKRGISRASFERFTSGLTPELKIMDFMDRQPEFSKALWDYLDVLVNERRIARGREVLAQYRSIFDAVERAYGVDRYAIAAIWGIESNYSTNGGERPVLRSTATLACVGRRKAYFKDEFLAALEILHRGDLRPHQLVGSWAGAFGPTQFMPTSFKRFAVDFDGDGRRDVVDSVADLIASTANNLKKDGWVTGETWGYEVAVPRGFDFMHADKRHMLTLAQWQSLGVHRANGEGFPMPHDKAFLLAPAGAQGPAFLMLQNFRAIMRYNPAEAYALAIGHFADRLRGGPPLVQNWPRHERVLSRDERLELQQRLVQQGFDPGTPDGRLGSQTRAALRRFQASIGHPADGFATASILDQLRRN